MNQDPGTPERRVRGAWLILCAVLAVGGAAALILAMARR